MAQCVAKEEMEFLERAILHSLRDFEGPIAIGLPSGHVNGANITLPLNIRVRLDAVDEESPRLEFLEAAVGDGR
jgi:muramoyltetrapeptide carboxypeptidase